MLRPDETRIRHMLDAARDIRAFIGRRTLRGLERDRIRALAVVHLFEILGEAASGLSDEVIEANPEVRWRDIIAMRNRLIHGYHDVNLEIVWSTARRDLPVLIPQLERILAEGRER
jgi:uncharacterized protein with HEPN domain